MKFRMKHPIQGINLQILVFFKPFINHIIKSLTISFALRHHTIVVILNIHFIKFDTSPYILQPQGNDSQNICSNLVGTTPIYKVNSETQRNSQSN